VLSLEDFGMREPAARQADDLYELINERAGRSPSSPATNSPRGLVPAVPQPVVAESLIDRLINTSHQVFMDGPSDRSNKRPWRVKGDKQEGPQRVETSPGPTTCGIT
jgi:DNA replication protein DnaC